MMNKNRIMLPKIIVFIFFISLFLSGCFLPESKLKPPLIPPDINAKLPSYGWVGATPSWSVSDDYDALVLFYVDYIVKYAKQTRRILNNDWYICKLNKISTIEGQFEDIDISFLTSEAHVKPGGILFNTPSMPYKRGMVLLLGLKANKKNYEIVSQEQRSWIEPYGKFNKPEGNIENFDKIINSVLLYFDIRDHNIEISSVRAKIFDSDYKNLICYIEVIEETKEFEIIQIYINGKNNYMIVNKTTFDVNYLPVPKSIDKEEK